MAHSLRYEVNCSILFIELPLLQRLAAARDAGFGGVEFWWPFDRLHTVAARVVRLMPTQGKGSRLTVCRRPLPGMRRGVRFAGISAPRTPAHGGPDVAAALPLRPHEVG